MLSAFLKDAVLSRHPACPATWTPFPPSWVFSASFTVLSFPLLTHWFPLFLHPSVHPYSPTYSSIPSWVLLLPTWNCPCQGHNELDSVLTSGAISAAFGLKHFVLFCWYYSFPAFSLLWVLFSCSDQFLLLCTSNGNAVLGPCSSCFPSDTPGEPYCPVHTVHVPEVATSLSPT